MPLDVHFFVKIGKFGIPYMYMYVQEFAADSNVTWHIYKIWHGKLMYWWCFFVHKKKKKVILCDTSKKVHSLFTIPKFDRKSGHTRSVT